MKIQCRLAYLIGMLLLTFFCSAQHISGRITDSSGAALSFASISIKGSSIGVSANAKGEYSLQVDPGNYVLQCMRVGFKTAEKEIILDQRDIIIDFILSEQQYALDNITVKTGQEDPAYAIIRKAIEKRPDYEQELQRFQCEVYIKGTLRLRKYPKKFLGKTVDFEDGDTSQQKFLYLSESVATFAQQPPDKVKTDVVSTKVSGNNNAYGLALPQMLSLYHNTIKIGENLNPRGFISPIADNALKFYNYKFEGTFYDGKKMINRIKVSSKRTFEPTFSGYINIMEDDWRIHSVQLMVAGKRQMQYLDTLRLEQIYIPYDNKWVLKHQVIYPQSNVFGFDIFGNFIQVFDKFNLNPIFPDDYFNNVVVKYDVSSNTKPAPYWDSIRPIPLQPEEARDYRFKDSLENMRQQPEYIDSLDLKRNKEFRPIAFVLGGKKFIRRRLNRTITFPAIFDILSYNTVEGTVVNFSPEYFKEFKQSHSYLDISPNIRYGFTNHHFNARLSAVYGYGKRHDQSISFSAGKRVFQFNPLQPITSRDNTIATLVYERNIMKLYEAWFTRFRYSNEIADGFTLKFGVEYQHRYPLENTGDYTIFDIKGREFTPNYPTNIVSSNIPEHKALVANINFLWQPGIKYIQKGGERTALNSGYPTFELGFTQGFNKWLGSDIQYNKWNFSVSDDIDLRLGGKLQWRWNVGGFIDTTQLYLPDYQHYYDNRTVSASPYLKSFQIMHYYDYSNKERFQTSAHLEYHLNGFLSNKIPLMKKWNWFFVAGGNALYVNKDKQYGEIFLSIENILKIFRIDFIEAFQKNQTPTSGVRILFAGILGGVRED
ncbi:DUF5686 and carboxypeptidase regulatory-like domain-containing protein [Danxiaibacter flavus]|uniref:DUF5686 and carboxypeptidase regulatory-like domain-containing protein n=1 Tax=Danxiaibacter flavus TaxID=3049108 RepID=A0ABV3ZC48_9BACT|nr:DUF5686 and carboxypeptidase regulatory-like domain-containing protein [Chitinophagaceae bacterium DXS]